MKLDFKVPPQDTPSLAEQSYDRSLTRLRALHGAKSVEYQRDVSIALGRNIVREETGGFASEDSQPAVPPFDEVTRDRLILNGREDVVAVFSMVSASLERVGKIEKNVKALLVLVVTSLLFNILILLTILVGA